MNPSRWDAEAITSNDRKLSFHQPAMWMSAKSGIVREDVLVAYQQELLQESLALHSVFRFSVQQYESHGLFASLQRWIQQMQLCQCYAASEFNRTTEAERSLQVI